MSLSRRIFTYCISILLLAIMAGCSTTRRLAPGEILYTGVKPLKIESPKGENASQLLGSQIKTAIDVAPNNSLYSPYLRYPFPLGLWVYNFMNDPGHGIKHWIYNKLVEEPVLISDVRPEHRVKLIEQILDNNGFFNNSVSYELVQRRNKRKASIRYNISSGNAFKLDSIILLPDSCHLYHMIDSVALRSKYLKPGQRYATDSLSAERIRITNVLRNRGYYFFRPEYIEYLADSTLTRDKIALKLILASNTPADAKQRYVTGSVTTLINRQEGGGTPDTLTTNRGKVILMRPAKFRQQLIPDYITFREGKIFRVSDMNRTQNYLSRLGIFDGIDIIAYPDTAAKRPTLNVFIDCRMAAPWQANFEVNVASKSNSYVGPGARIGLVNRNIFGGGETLDLGLTGSYEWQTGRSDKKSLFNSYEAGLTSSLTFPRLIAPKFVPRRKYAQNWTHFNLSGRVLNRPHYFMLGQLDGAFGYDWQTSRHVSTSLNVFKLTYNKLMHSTVTFDSIMRQNPALAQSFHDRFIPQITYTYNYSRLFNHRDEVNFTLNLQEAGNLFWAIWRMGGNKTGNMKLFGTPFSQFVKASAQLVYGRKLTANNIWLVSRIASGAAHAYGNASVVPYSEQFYVGGANSIRAFTVRSLGPGSYRPQNIAQRGYFDQTGTFKLELNTELRFPIYSIVHGAVFIDSGNVWLLKPDNNFPGGELTSADFLRDLALGTGVGLRLDLGMMIVRGDLGIGLHAPYKTFTGDGRPITNYFNIRGRDIFAFHLALGYPF